MAKKISHAQFQSEHREYKEIQEDAKQKHGELPNGRAKRYYQSAELSFVFEKQLVLELLSHPGTEFLRVYYGALPQNQGNPNQHGRPTLILGAAVGNSYFDVGTFYVQWPDGVDENGNPLP